MPFSKSGSTKSKFYNRQSPVIWCSQSTTFNGIRVALFQIVQSKVNAIYSQMIKPLCQWNKSNQTLLCFKYHSDAGRLFEDARLHRVVINGKVYGTSQMVPVIEINMCE